MECRKIDYEDDLQTTDHKDILQWMMEKSDELKSKGYYIRYMRADVGVGLTTVSITGILK